MAGGSGADGVLTSSTIGRERIVPGVCMMDNRSGVFRLMDYWIETAAYRPGWQSGDGRMSELPVRFISRYRPQGSFPAVLASVAGFSGVFTWPDDLLEGNMSADDTLIHEEVEEIVSLAAAVSSPLDVPL
ncbi:hypothetical protein AXG93_625s1270 [Marchantia polymorpha subsp. ruderalis]|uniref:Uncharacterized protein n=1 Tax=Marchantia polymorpha subsp. ruderalis TaxID=1480154 RepID=A0A176VD86_MARPO|nr:hypothetical protein AXG93_625s1270 [Marchantia polymorpha subsp. ruderalis]